MELLRNPFYTLGATMRDDRRRIVDLAEEKSLVSDETALRDATGMLTNPRRRVAAEIGWLPGLGPKRISEAIAVLNREPAKVRGLENLPSLARANLLADGLIRVAEQLAQRELALWIIELAEAHEEIEAEQTVTLLNEERSVAGFPAISDLHNVDAELQARRQYYRKAITSALDRLPTTSLVEIVTIVVDKATGNGERHAPILIDDLVDSFEVEAQGFFEKETENIAVLAQSVLGAIERQESEEHITHLVAELERVVNNWDLVAQPIQLSARSRGTSHSLSHEVAEKIRSLAVDVFNEHGLLDISKRLTALLQEVFAEVDPVVEQSETDASTLDEIAEQRSQFLAEMQARAKSWESEITYQARVGRKFEDTLRISPEGVEWNGSRVSLEEIKRVRWSGAETPVGTMYWIFVGDEDGDTRIVLQEQQVYSAFVECLWKAVGVRLLTEMLEGLRGGKGYRFGTAIVTDYGVELERGRLFSPNERVSCKWTDLVIENGDGTFAIVKRNERRVAVELEYYVTDNVHILEAAMRVFWKRPSPRLSDLLDMAN